MASASDRLIGLSICSAANAMTLRIRGSVSLTAAPRTQGRHDFATKRDQCTIIPYRGRACQSLTKMTDGLSFDCHEISFCKPAPRDCLPGLALRLDEDYASQPLCIDHMLCVSGDGGDLATDIRVLRIKPKPAAKREGNLNGMMRVRIGAPRLA